jgi:hypothetical protein
MIHIHIDHLLSIWATLADQFTQGIARVLGYLATQGKETAHRA